MDSYETIMRNVKFIENNPALAKEINKLPFVPWHNFFIKILQKFPLSLGKEKAILKNRKPKITFGILIDHFMGLASKFGIPQIYIRNVSSERYWNKQGNNLDSLEEEKGSTYKNKINFCTLDLVQALCEKIRERKNH